MSKSDAHLSIKLRLMSGDAIAFGPGKAELLKNIQNEGSISAAAKAMGMSYKRAWQLVETMNQSFESPLVETSKGGAERGGATVTELGAQVLTHYENIQQATLEAAKKQSHAFPGIKLI